MQQKEALAILKSGRNTFITGSAGTGKTYVLNQFIEYLRAHRLKAAVTASTGIAATHLNGVTIHSWAGIGIKDRITRNDLENLEGRAYFLKRIQGVKVLIIDEISMLHRNQLDMVDTVLRYFKEASKPFGGIQVVICGDFFQLPPIGNREEQTEDKFAFKAASWKEANMAVCYLTKQYRQNDQTLNNILNQIRTRTITEDTIYTLQNARANEPDSFGEPTQLFTHNKDVQAINQQQLEAIDSEVKLFTATLKGNPNLMDTLKKSVMAEEKLQLKLGAKVMFVKNNWDKGYINGTVGKVIDWDKDGFPIVETNEGNEIVAEIETWSIDNELGTPLVTFAQVPLRLAWAITVHKSQGMTLSSARVDLGKTFEKGQGYVALSRLQNYNALQLVAFNRVALEVDPTALDMDKEFQVYSDEEIGSYNEETLAKQQVDFVKNNKGKFPKAGTKSMAPKAKIVTKEKSRGSSKNISTYMRTLELVITKASIKEIAEQRELAESTIVGHIVKIKEAHPSVDLKSYQPSKAIIAKVSTAKKILEGVDDRENFTEDGVLKLGAIRTLLQNKLSFDEIKLALAFENS